jgi:hypothetical protein
VRDRRGGACDVIGPGTGEAVHMGPDHANRPTEGTEGDDLRFGQGQGHEQHAVDPLTEQAGGAVALAHLRVTYVVEEQVEPGFPYHLLDTAEQFGEEPPGQVGHDDGHRAPPTGGEPVGDRTNAAAELFGRLPDALGHARRDATDTAEGPGHAGGRDPRHFGHFFDRRLEQAAPTSGRAPACDGNTPPGGTGSESRNRSPITREWRCTTGCAPLFQGAWNESVKLVPY